MTLSHPKIPLFSAEAVHAGIDLHSPIRQVLDSHWYVLGQAVQAFEADFARYIGVAHCVGVANGTDALELGLRAAGVCSGDEVVTVANAGFYSSTAIRAIGAAPLYVDVDPVTLTLSPDALANALASKPRAIVVTHLYGRMADMGRLLPMARAAGIPVVEDCAQAHGAALNGRRAGSLGTIGCFSFYPTKNLGAVGDGGAVVADDDALAATLRQLRQYGWSQKYRVDMEGGRNSRLDELQAAVLSAKLPHLEAWNTQRRNIAQRYNDAFSALPLKCPDISGSAYVAHLYVLRCGQRDALRAHLAARGVATDIHYPIPDHRQPIELQRSHAALPVTEQSASECLTLPCFPGLSDEAVSHIIAAVRDFFAH